MIFDGFSHQLPDIDPGETEEWIDSLDAVVDQRGKARAQYLLMRLLELARSRQVGFPATVSTPYVNTIPPDQEPWFPGNEDMERSIRRYVRWNAAVMVTRANMRDAGIGGHLSTYASSASLYEVGFNHFFRGKDEDAGDQIFYQGHASPGIYARAFVEGRLDETQLDNFRFEVDGNGLSSYPHPRLMPEFWEFPTVSMGLGPINAVYQAHFNRYLEHRGIVDTSTSRVWAFVGDGEFDEPESKAGLSLAAREGLDNLVFVVNCNLQRLDGPVRGNGKIIQELEALFRGNGWNVIKVIWGTRWDELLARDVDGVLLNKMNITPDGDFQKLATESGAYIREHFFGPDPRLGALVEHLSDAELQSLPRGGHDYHKLYAAYRAATEHRGSPTVILAKTIKGWTLGPGIEARNATHQIKKMTTDQLRTLRDTLHLTEEISDEALEAEYPPYHRPDPGSAVYGYMMNQRRQLGGSVPRRVVRGEGLTGLVQPEPAAFAEFWGGSRGQSVSTTMAFARMLRNLLRDPNLGKFVVPIIPDEGRTFGLDALFAEVKIYAPGGQTYTSVDAGLLLQYSESQQGQIMEEGINEAGAMASFIAAATSYATWSRPMLPFYLYYSMFGFQRTGDAIWQLGDQRGRGFLLGCTAGRTTLNGEGLQHEDGHSLVLAETVPNVCSYDPAFAYEVATIVQYGINDMYGPEGRDVFYYVTLYNENYPMPEMRPGHEEEIKNGIIRGLYRFAERAVVNDQRRKSKGSRKATILFSGSAWHEAMRARDILATDWNVSAEAWSVTSYKSLRENALETERWNRLHPTETPRIAYVREALSSSAGPIVAVSDFMKAVPDMISRFVERPFATLGTDGYGRSDTRESLRRHFEIDAEHIVVAVLSELFAIGFVSAEEVANAIKMYDIDAEAIDPRLA
ncbi:MAG TPA: pyruvate dehydrogenase (acetyl-transferring), homodimeric type [Acidimicrobiales bacterium]|nr:pyruvate dehydrogenase (acetyl-transferring), homodimeric type [Acidimicrobiales bacterium]